MSRDVLKIDEDALDAEWFRQADLMYDASVAVAEARLDLERKKSRLLVIYARVEKQVRGVPKKFGIVKVTEAAVKAEVLSHERYQKALTKVQQCEFEVNIRQSLVTALSHKKSALQDLVTLHGQNYFASPHTQNEDAREQMQDARKKRIRKKARDDDDNND